MHMLALSQLPCTPQRPNNAVGRKMGCWRSPAAWVNWNRKILQILSNWFSDALQYLLKFTTTEWGITEILPWLCEDVQQKL